MIFYLSPQAPHNLMTYELIGNSKCQHYFGIVESTGGLFVKSDLVADPSKAVFYTVRIYFVLKLNLHSLPIAVLQTDSQTDR